MKKSFNWLTIILGIMFISSFLLLGCDSNNFNVKTKIYPKLTKISSHDIAVQYYLGDLLVLDEWKHLNAAQVLFLMDPAKEKTVTLTVEHVGDCDCTTVYFNYNIESIEIRTENPVSIPILFEHVESFPGVSWNIKNNKTIKKEPQVDNSLEEKKPEKGSLNKKI